MKLKFTKMEGAGNDFVVIDNRSGAIEDGASVARVVCDRHFGVGADGLLLLERSGIGDFRMMYYNADGSYGGMCGNGGRCVALYAWENGIAGKSMRFEALGHLYSARVESAGIVTLKMKDPGKLQTDIVLPLKGGTVRAAAVDTGAPHVIIFVEELKSFGYLRLRDVSVAELGREIRFHDRFQPAGTNVNFVEKDGTKMFHVRTYERGVEAETLACGTGSIAVAIVAVATRGFDPPVEIMPASGKRLRVDFERLDGGKRIEGIELSGEARNVFTGEIEIVI